MPGRLFPRSVIQDIFDSSCILQPPSDIHSSTFTSFESTTSLLYLPEVWTPAAQYLIDVGLRPSLAQRLSDTYVDFVARNRKLFESYFNCAISKGCHLSAECYRSTFIVQFKRTIQVWDSQFVSVVRVLSRQAGVPMVSFHPERVDIRVDDAAKAEIIARLGIKATQLTSDRRVTSPGADVTFRVSKQTHSDAADSRLLATSKPVFCATSPSTKLSGSQPTLSTSRYCDPFRQAAPPTCFPAPYPPPPVSCLPQKAFATSFIPCAAPQVVPSSANHSSDISTLTNLFGRMAKTTLERIPRNHGVSRIPASNRIEPFTPILSPSVSNTFARPQLTSVESIASPPKPTNTPRRRKMAPLPARRGKTSASPSHPTTCMTSPPTERAVEETSDHAFASPQKPHPVSILSPSHTAEASCIATSKPSTHKQRKEHTLHKSLSQPQTIPRYQALTPLATTGETFSYDVSRSPPLVSDATSYFDSPPTSSDELDTPPSTPPSSHVLLASTSTESLAISSESDRIVSHKEPLGDTKLPYPRLRYRRLDFTKGCLGRDEQPLTFTFSV